MKLAIWRVAVVFSMNTFWGKNSLLHVGNIAQVPFFPRSQSRTEMGEMRENNCEVLVGR